MILLTTILTAVFLAACGADGAIDMAKDGRVEMHSPNASPGSADTRPPAQPQAASPTQPASPATGRVDPTRQTASAAQPAGLTVSCTLDDVKNAITCTARGYTEDSRMFWWTNTKGLEAEGDSFTFTAPSTRRDIKIMLEACVGSSCRTVETILDTPGVKSASYPTQAPSKTAQESIRSGVTTDPAAIFTARKTYESFSDDIESALKSLVENEFNAATEKAGITVAVYRDGRLWSYAAGNARSTVPMTVDTPVLIRSVSKTFIAALIMKQIATGAYTLSDTISSVLAGHSDYALLDSDFVNPDVTVSQLLSMTSGIADYAENKGPDYTAIQTASSWKPADLLKLIGTPYRPPGNYSYSNSNSVILGLIAEHHGGLPLNRLLKQVFFAPLGVVAGLLPQDAAPAEMAHPHTDRATWGLGDGFGDISEVSWLDDWFLQSNRATWIGGGMVTTARNLAHWGYELFSEQGRAATPASRETLLGSFAGDPVIIGGPLHWYGYHVTKLAIELDDGSSLIVYGHPGGGGGFTSIMYYSPELDISVAVIANSSSNVRGRRPTNTILSHGSLYTVLRNIYLQYVQAEAQ